MRKISTTSYLAGLRAHLVPFVVWACTVAFIAVLFSRQTQRFETLGIVQGEIRAIAATCTGRLVSVPVQLFEQVQAGDTVAIIDTILENEQSLRAELNAQLASAEAERERLQGELVTVRETLQSDRQDRQTTRLEEQRRFSSDVEDIRLQILDWEATIAADQILLGDLAMDVKVAKQLFSQDAIEYYELKKLEAQYESLQKKIEKYQQLVSEAEANLRQAEQRRAKYLANEPNYPDAQEALASIQRQIQAQEQVMEHITQQLEAVSVRQTVELKAPFDGVVIPIPLQNQESGIVRSGEKVLRRAGEVVSAGDPILAIAQSRPKEILAYVNEDALGQVHAEMQVEMTKSRERAQIAQSVVLAVSPTAQRKPERLWRNPNMPEWGWPVLMQVPPGFNVVAGEVVRVRGW